MLQKQKHNVILLGLFFLHIFLMWPGYLTSDSQTQYNIAITGQYSDHHPFIMSFLWRYLDMLHKGPGLMLFMHLGLLYGSVYFLLKSITDKKLRPLVLILPLIPHVLSYSGMIWKDVGCAYAFLFVSSYLTYVTMNDRPLPFTRVIPLLIVLAYGTLVKFQAQYLAPIVLLWMVTHRAKHSLGYPFVKNAVVLIGLFYTIMMGVQHFGPKVEENHSWQYVKLYDLAAIAVNTNQDIFPNFTKTKTFSMAELHKRFNHQRVDDLVFADSLLIKGKNTEEREIVLKTWIEQIIKHPFIYLRHRAANLAYVLLSTPWFEYGPPVIDSIVQPGTALHTGLYYTARIFGWIFLAHMLPMLLGLGYLILGTMAWCKKVREGIPLFFMNFIGMGMGFVLFFFSMAGTPRYTYISICLVHASHAFAYLCWKKLRPQKT